MYPNKYYEKSTDKDNRYIFLGNQRLGIVEKEGANTTLYLNFTDHLNSSSVTTDNQGNITNLIDYMPFGTDRVNVQNQGFSPSYKFTDQENDPESGLMNFDARYYEQNVGRFIQSDPVALYLVNEKELKNKIGKELWEILSNPIALNAYAYTGNNPLVYTDPDGEFRINFFAILPQRTQISIGNWGNRVYNDYSVAKYAMDHPVQTGLAAGIAGGAIVAGGTLAAGGSITCGILCGGTAATVATTGEIAATQGDKISQYTQKYGQSIAEKMVKAAEIFGKEGIKINEHGLLRTVIREARGVNAEKVIETFKQGVRYWDKVYNNISYFKDGIRIVVDEAKQITTVVTQNSMDPSRFIKLD